MHKDSRRWQGSVHRIALFLPILLVLLPGPLRAEIRTDKRLFVLQADAARLIEYNLADFQIGRTVALPGEAVTNKAKFFVNHNGQILAFVYPGDGLMVPVQYWVWDGSKAQTIRAKETRGCPDCDQDSYGMPYPVLAADGSRLYWYETRMEVMKHLERDGYSVPIVTATFQVSQTDLGGTKKQVLFQQKIPSCICETGVCTETCPVGQVWAPAEGIDAFLFVTYWIPGQIERTYQATSLLQKKGNVWRERKLSRVCEEILDAAAGGDIIIEALPDDGCCGWENASNDVTKMRKNGREITLFDEFQRYGNADYDISFFIENARISPGLSLIAHTVASTRTEEQKGTEIRLTESANPTLPRKPGEMTRLQKLAKGHPLVEVLTTASPSRRLWKLPKASLIGWLNDQEVLVFKERKLIILDARTGRQRQTLPFAVEKAEQVFLR